MTRGGQAGLGLSACLWDSVPLAGVLWGRQSLGVVDNHHRLPGLSAELSTHGRLHAQTRPMPSPLPSLAPQP